MYYPHHYTGPTSTSSAYSSPYLSRSSRMHHSAISAGGNCHKYIEKILPQYETFVNVDLILNRVNRIKIIEKTSFSLYNRRE